MNRLFLVNQEEWTYWKCGQEVDKNASRCFEILTLFNYKVHQYEGIPKGTIHILDINNYERMLARFSERSRF